MRRVILITLAAATLAATGWAARGAATEPARPAPAAHQHPGQTAASDSRSLATRLARARLATAKYATGLRAAKADGYQIITRMIPDMGWHFLNPTIQGFDVTKPPILVYERHGDAAGSSARWSGSSPRSRRRRRCPGRPTGRSAAACHYKDGTFVSARVQELCAKRSPETGAAFNFWHPDLVTLHVWLWYPNPAGLYSGTNPYIQPFNHG